MSKKEIKYVVSIFVLAFVPKAFIALQMIPYPVYDEGGSMAFAAYLAGKDWSNIISTGAYYGFGYYFFYTPIFKITNNPYIIYKLVCLGNAFVQAICGLIAYMIISRYLGNRSTYIQNSIIAVLCSYLVTVRVNAYNENGIILISWLISLLICMLIDTEELKKKKIISIILWGLATWGLTIHTRAIILVIALLIIMVIYKVIYKEELFPKAIYIIGITLFTLSKVCIKLVQGVLWNNEAGNIHNASVNVSKHLDNFNFMDINAWKAIIYVIIGQINALNIFSGSLLIFSIIFSIYYIVKNWRLDDKKYKFFCVIVCTFLACFFGMIIGQAITWGDGVFYNLSQSQRNVDVYKSFTYVRYACAYMGPIILCGLVQLNNEEKNIRKILLFSVVISIVVHLYWLENIMPLISESLTPFESFVALAFRKPRQSINIEMYYRVTAWFIVLTSLSFGLLSQKYKRTYLLAITTYLIFQFLYTGYFNDVYYGKEHSTMAIETYDFLKYVQKKSEDFTLNKIYMYNGDLIREQFYFNDLEIVVGIPKERNAILLYKGEALEDNKLLNYVIRNNGSVIPLENNIYIFVIGREYFNIFSEAEVTCVDINELMEKK